MERLLLGFQNRRMTQAVHHRLRLGKRALWSHQLRCLMEGFAPLCRDRQQPFWRIRQTEQTG